MRPPTRHAANLEPAATDEPAATLEWATSFRTVAILEPAAWRGRREAHAARVDDWIKPHLDRRGRGVKHPVEDFLFTYYSCRPAQLRRWHPGAGIVLAGASTAEFGGGYRAFRDGADLAGDGAANGAANGATDGMKAGTTDGVTLDVTSVMAHRGQSVAWIRGLLTATATRQPQFGCFGMHEWAMVYRQGQQEVRHNAWPLRLTPARIAAVVDERGIRCSHFDAFRFFTPAARPLNVLQPSRQTQYADEQPGCLHANMDLYKHSYKLSPLIPSELIADCFALARDIRVIDMRASPYDLTELGYPPVRVETAEGRQEYVQAQRAFAERADALRARLVMECDRLLAASNDWPTPPRPGSWLGCQGTTSD